MFEIFGGSSSLICCYGFLFCFGFGAFGVYRRPLAGWALGCGWDCIWRGGIYWVVGISG